MTNRVDPKRHILKTQQYSLEELDELFRRADALRGQRTNTLAGKIVAMLFYEPSTRTRFSFESATCRLGGKVIGTENAEEFSSAAKGETIEDTIRVLGHYADAIVLRHREDDAAERAAAVSSVPILNAGCGMGQHPTQGLLDAYTIRRRLKNIGGLRVAIMGDLKHGRTVRSLAYLLGKYPGVHLLFVSPPALCLKDDMREHFREHGIKYTEYEHLDDIIASIDVLYVTRLQTERMDEEEKSGLQGSYSMNRALAIQMKKNAIIMHPLPRVHELSTDVDGLPGAVYLTEQVESGLLVRMALLEQLLG